MENVYSLMNRYEQEYDIGAYATGEIPSMYTYGLAVNSDASTIVPIGILLCFILNPLVGHSRPGTKDPANYLDLASGRTNISMVKRSNPVISMSYPNSPGNPNGGL